ncbi:MULTISPECIES: hypothetical protein [Pedobacter]|uniref:hypothetical protein n=1 Tax=Pedobacter TaxID=84567 RepID=UPI002108F5D4|nr:MULTISPECIES: hypothetical protein [unclassified Pedobacter]
MKHVITLLFLSIAFLTQAQESTLGNNDYARLSPEEAQFLTEYFSEQKVKVDFKGKKVAFITGQGGTVISTKSSFFKYARKYKADGGTWARKLKFREFEQTGGYNIIVAYGGVKNILLPKLLFAKLRREGGAQKEPGNTGPVISYN